MHRDAYRVVRPPSCLAILIKNMSILRQGITKLRSTSPAIKATLQHFLTVGLTPGDRELIEACIFIQRWTLAIVTITENFKVVSNVVPSSVKVEISNKIPLYLRS